MEHRQPGLRAGLERNRPAAFGGLVPQLHELRLRRQLAAQRVHGDPAASARPGGDEADPGPCARVRQKIETSERGGPCTVRLEAKLRPHLRWHSLDELQPPGSHDLEEPIALRVHQREQPEEG